MSGYYPSSCDDLIPAHNCDPCLPREFGRVRAVAFIKKSFAFTNPEDASEWEAGILSGDIILIPEVNGMLAEPTETEGPGYGDTESTVLGYKFEVTYFDKNYASNCDFYNAIKNSGQYKFMYKSETLGHLTDVTVTVVPKAPIENDLTSQVVWGVKVKFTQGDNPCPFVFPADQLTCYIQGGV